MEVPGKEVPRPRCLVLWRSETGRLRVSVSTAMSDVALFTPDFPCDIRETLAHYGAIHENVAGSRLARSIESCDGE